VWDALVKHGIIFMSKGETKLNHHSPNVGISIPQWFCSPLPLMKVFDRYFSIQVDPFEDKR